MVAHTARALLEHSGIVWTDEIERTLVRYLDLVREWNPVCSLVSKGDLDALEERHLIDSLSLVPVIVRLGRETGVLLDVGTGGGFPALPVKVVLPGLQVALVERSDRKVGFLRKALAVLELRGVEILCGEFPRMAEGQSPDVITARAVEKPEKVLADVLQFLAPDSVFLCQSSAVGSADTEMFHVEHVEDEWTNSGLRRGRLDLVTRRPLAP